MSTRRRSGRAACSAVCFVIGVQVGAAALYLVQYRAEAGRPLYLGIFAVVALSTFVTVDRLVNHHVTPTGDHADRRPPAD
ncbi:hypothetical protein [Kitasatospora sp. NPDC087315]|uniref:hypothetical protein n=1 Tax=Kitasatospora sp. NPDC087315 TaxID=3364069 RepID=UPI0037FDB610